MLKFFYLSIRNEYEWEEGIKECHYDTVQCIIMFSCKGWKILILSNINYTDANYGPLFQVKLSIIFNYIMTNQYISPHLTAQHSCWAAHHSNLRFFTRVPSWKKIINDYCCYIRIIYHNKIIINSDSIIQEI